MLFVVVVLVVTAIWKRRAILATAAGAIPGLLLTLAFRASIPKSNASQLGGSVPAVAHRALDLSRYGTILGAFGRGFANMGIGWFHPVWPLIILAFALRFDWQRRKDLFLSGAAAGMMLLGYFAVYTVTAYDLSWQLQTSLDRLLVQTWPLLVVTFFAALTGSCGSRCTACAFPAAAAKSRKTGPLEVAAGTAATIEFSHGVARSLHHI